MEDVDLLQTATYFTSNILSDYLQVVYKTSFGLRKCVYCWTTGCTPREKLHEELRSQSGFKVNNRNNRTSCEICSKLATKTPEPRH